MLKFVFCLKNYDSADLIPCLSLQERPECLKTNILGKLLSIENQQARGIHVILHIKTHVIIRVVLMELLMKSSLHFLLLFKMVLNNSKYSSTCHDLSWHLWAFYLTVKCLWSYSCLLALCGLPTEPLSHSATPTCALGTGHVPSTGL